MLAYVIFIALFVGFLLYVSSRIRRAANEAFEPETIENEKFKIFKPEGYLNPLDENTKFPFEAYSRELGEKSAGRLKKSLVKLEEIPGLNFDAAREKAKQNADEVFSEVMLAAPSEQRICQIEAKKTDDGISRLVFHKIVESERKEKTFDLQISILEAHADEYMKRISDMINSFTVK